MAIFGGKKETTQSKNTTPEDNKTNSTKNENTNTATIITACTEITGNLKGCDTIHIDGTFHGNIVADQLVVVGKGGTVNGNIKAQKIIVNGSVKGSATCADLEVMRLGSISHKIDADRVIVDGNVEGDVLAKTSVNILKNGHIKTNLMNTKRARVNGSVEGRIITTELLEVGRDGYIQGEIVVKNIRTEEGGRLNGTMSTYEDITEKSAEAEKERVAPKSTAPVKEGEKKANSSKR